MYSTVFQTFALGAALAARYVSAAVPELSVLTPVLTECENATVKLSGGQPNYLVSVVPSADPCSDSLISIPQTSQTSVNFLVNLAAGTSVDIVVDSADGQEAWSATAVVQPGSNKACLSKVATGAAANSSTVASSVASSASVPSASAVSGSSGSGSDSTSPWAAPPPAVQSGTIGGSDPNSSDGSVNVGTDPNTSGAVPSTVISVGSIIATTLFGFAVSQL